VRLWLEIPHEVDHSSIRHKGEFIAGDFAGQMMAESDREGHAFAVPKRRKRAREEHGHCFRAALRLAGVLSSVPQEKYFVEGKRTGGVFFEVPMPRRSIHPDLSFVFSHNDSVVVENGYAVIKPELGRRGFPISGIPQKKISFSMVINAAGMEKQPSSSGKQENP